MGAAFSEEVGKAAQADLNAAAAALSPEEVAKLKTALEGVKAGKQYKLTYFDVRGVAEVIRLVFAVAQQPYEDERFPLNFGTPGDFSTITRPEFDAKKASGALDAGMGKVPILTVDGVQFGQSKAIERYLANQFGMLGSTPIEGAIIEQLCETVIDIKEAYNKAKNTTGDDEKKAAVEKFFAEGLGENLQKTEKSLPNAGAGGWLVGDKVSLADIVYYNFLAAPSGFFDNAEGAKAAFAGCPRIAAAMAAVDAIPQLKAYLAARKQTAL